jgi:hypothetical protein
MKTIKILTFIILTSVFINASAQNDSPVPQKRTDYIKKHVSGITSDQEYKILNIEQNCLSALQNATNSKVKDSIRRSSDSQIKAVLTPDQYSQYRKIKKNLPKEDKGSY